MTAPEPLDWPPHERRVVPWRQRTERGPRADRQLREIEVQVPPLVAGASFAVDRPLGTSMANALGGLAQLDDSHGRRLQALNQLLLRTESVASSKIEDVEASMADYGRAVLGVRANASAVSMAAATDALAGIITDAQEHGVLRREALLAAHRVLFRRSIEQGPNAGRFRTVQNWIGGSDFTPRNALYVPPPPEHIEPLLDDLFAFARRDDVPVLVQAAVVHAQFECIHPFVDGNGRIGRTLVHAVLRRRRATQHLTVPIASALVAHREKYFDAIRAYAAGRARPMVAMLTAATVVATHESRRTASNLHEVRREWDERLGPVVPGTTTHRVVESLLLGPTVQAAPLADRLGVPVGEVEDAVGRLTEAGVLVPLGRRRRDRVWAAQDVLDELADLNDRIVAVSRLGPDPT